MAAVILLGVLIIEDQLEGHLLQPQVVGRVSGCTRSRSSLRSRSAPSWSASPGAVVAVPVVAVITRALPELRRRQPGDLGPDDPSGVRQRPYEIGRDV